MGALNGRVAFVTGAASGIGRASALALAAEGAIVFVTDIDAPGGRQTVEMIEAAGGKATFRGQDVTEEQRWAELIKRVMALYGRLDILVNNAGIGTSGLITDVTLEQWNRQMDINVTSCFLGIKHALPAMRTPRPDGHVGGSIINISSVAGLGGSAGMSAYCASKGAVRLLSKAVAMECAAMKDSIRSNSVHPGIIDTPIWQKIDTSGTLSSALATAGQPGANAIDVDAVGAGAPVGHAGQPEDIAAGIVFLASDASRYMTGAELVIDGGWTAH
ncbi:SDR family oxidoreductase [Sandarakinorhabdus sp.]|uniref:SDR family NAD(P)-dependent oxidoreductase n=1 Tax=Sandarakinorhabdus sp. TaxID=1916663 RepID=UPI003341712D